MSRKDRVEILNVRIPMSLCVTLHISTTRALQVVESPPPSQHNTQHVVLIFVIKYNFFHVFHFCFLYISIIALRKFLLIKVTLPPLSDLLLKEALLSNPFITLLKCSEKVLLVSDNKKPFQPFKLTYTE